MKEQKNKGALGILSLVLWAALLTVLVQFMAHRKTDAADRIPKDSRGLFLNQDGVLFRGYLFDDKTILPEGDTRPTL